MIVITGATGFIGSRMVQHLNESGRSDLVLVKDYPVMPVETCHGASLQGVGASLQNDGASKMPSCPDVETCHGASLQDEGTSLQELRYIEKIPRDFFFDWLALNQQNVDFIIHLGAEIDTLPEDTACYQEQILEFSQRLWSFAAMNRIPLLFAAESTEAKWHWTGHEWVGWGCGVDPSALPAQLGQSIPALQSVPTPQSAVASRIAEAERLKRQFDQWVLKQRVTPPLWAGFAMPEVYGPHEERLGDAASSVFQLFRQWKQEGRMIIPVYEGSENSDNEPVMDRIFVKDVATVFTWFMNHLPASGFYGLGTGYPRPLSAVAKIVFSILRQEEKIEFVSLSKVKDEIPNRKIDLPLNSLRKVGYKKNFTPLEKGIRIFVREFLKK